MVQKISLRNSLLCLCAITVCILFVLSAIRSATHNDTPIAPIVSVVPAVSRAKPIGLIIPAINVDAIIEPIGLTPEGALGAPAGPYNAGWFSRGVTPGDKGVAIIDGHYGWKDHIPAIFNNLASVKKGDRIFIYSAKGDTTIFTVTKIASYGENASTSDIFVSHDTGAHLVIVTCAGVWSVAEKSYSERVVVSADLEVL